MKNYFIILGIAIVFLGTGHSAFAQATTPPEYQFLAPLPINGAGSDPSGSVKINDYIPAIFKLAIGVAGGLAVLRIVMGGIKYMTTDAFDGKSDAKDTIRDAIVGLLLAISAFTILNTINPKLVDFSLILQGLPLGAPVTTSSTPPTTGPIAPITVDGVTLKEGDPWPNDSIDRHDIINRNISFNKLTCAKIGDTGCTSVYEIGDTVINGLTTLKKACAACDVKISGGTEYWLHSEGTAHKPGGNVVDLSLNPALQTFLQGKATDSSKGCAPGNEKYIYGGATYVKETPNLDHWHVCF